MIQILPLSFSSRKMGFMTMEIPLLQVFQRHPASTEIDLCEALRTEPTFCDTIIKILSNMTKELHNFCSNFSLSRFPSALRRRTSWFHKKSIA